MRLWVIILALASSCLAAGSGCAPLAAKELPTAVDTAPRSMALRLDTVSGSQWVDGEGRAHIEVLAEATIKGLPMALRIVAERLHGPWTGQVCIDAGPFLGSASLCLDIDDGVSVDLDHLVGGDR